MLQKQKIESILKINGASTTSSDDEIRSVLLSARYSSDEVEDAILVLRGNSAKNCSTIDGLHKVFRTGESLKPSEISLLLGIEVNIVELSDKKVVEAKKVVLLNGVIIVVVALILALLGVLFAMYIYKVGVFHPAVAMFR